MEKQAEINSVATLRLKEERDDVIIATIPGTDYELHLVKDGEITAQRGKRIRGEIHAKALRMHQSDTGGNWIEPIYGMPRIVQGTVLAVDRANRRVLFDMTVPMWITPREDQSLDDFNRGEMWNAHVESGTRFVPAP